MKTVRKNDTITNAMIILDKGLNWFEESITSICLCGMAITVIVGIVMRFILKMPNMYGEEISRYLTIIVVFIGISLGVKENAHLGIDSLVNALPGKACRAAKFISQIVTLLAYVVLAYLSFEFMLSVKKFGQKSPSMTFIPMYAIYSILFVGFALSCVRNIIIIWNNFFLNYKNFILTKKDKSIL